MVRSTFLLGPACLLVSVAAAMSPSHASASDEAVDSDRPRGTYVRMPALTSDVPTARGGSGAHILFLNRCTGGISIDAGWPDDNTVNRSGILNGTTQFPEYPFGDGSWSQVVEETTAIFSPFNVQVTDVDPSPAPHDEALVCGSGSLAGFSGAGGVAPFTCDVIPSPITFTFPESLGDDPRTIAEVIAQEAAHAWGLEHEYKCEDPMSYLYGCGEKTYQDGDYPCGEYSATSCSCGGATQNSYQYILGMFGSAVPDTQAPTAAITTPTDGEVFAVGDDFDIAVSVADDNEVVSVELYLDGELSSADMSDPFGPWPVIDAVAGSFEIYVIATDAAGKETVSGVVRFDVTPDGPGPDDSADDGGGSAPGDGGDEGDDSADGGGDDGLGEDGGQSALPPGYGLNDDATGCACTTDTNAPARGGWSAALLLVVGAVRRRRNARGVVGV